MNHLSDDFGSCFQSFEHMKLLCADSDLLPIPLNIVHSNNRYSGRYSLSPTGLMGGIQHCAEVIFQGKHFGLRGEMVPLSPHHVLFHGFPQPIQSQFLRGGAWNRGKPHCTSRNLCVVFLLMGLMS